LAFDIRHDVVEQPVDLTSRKDRDNVGMAEVRGEVHFANEPLAQQAGGHLRVEHFDRHAAMRVLLHRQEAPGHAPRADLAFGVAVWLLVRFVPSIPQLLDRFREVSLLETVASRNRLVEEATAAAGSLSQGQWALVTFLSMLTALLLVLPVSWVYMLTKQRSG